MAILKRVGLVAIGIVLGAGLGATADSGEGTVLECPFGFVEQAAFLSAEDSEGFDSPEDAVASFLMYARGEEGIAEFSIESLHRSSSDHEAVNVRTATGLRAHASVVRHASGGYSVDAVSHCTFLDEHTAFYAADQPFIGNAFIEDRK